jgi:hypothetical protein
MITSFLQGGVGNILYMVSAAYALAKENNDECAFDFVNGNFTQKPALVYRNNIFKQFMSIDLSKNVFTYYNEPYFHYKKIPYRNNILLYGYFQSEKYFKDYKNDLIKLLKDELIINSLKEIYKNILSNSISIHVRRGDYLKIQHYHPCPSINYYLDSIKLIDTKKDIKNILIFSDDIQWCKENFKDERITFIEGQQDYEDLYLMSLCENNIIANSSFSWWGSYLNEDNNKIVIAPKIWFGESANHNWKDIYYENVIVM